ncbi:LacI family DNA-binding transcriptional regulator [Amycolatopsis eburnea]|uniref:LacI family transcriptional regulator n=1 Tax=Amycolatopsis eburnea TaxID=2267691 RepID=A0A3R9DVE5_9PSEU|nr:LacI family DNA-binding transcriptional regulator [Amycolatopsis eburnea]RSD14781.1 LacI family transcriptional regulator [Amycolatopsis eburnea]
MLAFNWNARHAESNAISKVTTGDPDRLRLTDTIVDTFVLIMNVVDSRRLDPMNDGARMAVSLQDVANAAGVSIATASRALGNKGRVSEATMRLVRETADRLGYQVNTLGKALREGSDGVVGIVVPMVSNPFYASLVHEFEDHLAKFDLKMLIADSHGELDREIERLEALASRRVRGIFVVPAYFDESRPTIMDISRQLPVVQVDRRVENDEALSFVGIDNAGGIDQVLRHVSEQGAETVAFVGADDRTSVGRERRQAFAASVASLGLTAQKPVIDRYLFEFGLSAASQLMRRSKLPDAVIAGDDLIATGLLAGFVRRGRAVPEDVLITGFDGTILADICSPTLTTVRQPMAEIAEAAVTQLMRQIDDADSAGSHIRLRTTLRPGDSTGAATSGSRRRRG